MIDQRRTPKARNHPLRDMLVCVALIAPLLCTGCESDEVVGTIERRPLVVDFAGSNQIASPGGSLPAPLSIVVADDDGPVEGVNVSWSASEGTLSGESKTDSSGIATATWTLGSGTARRFASASGRIASSSVNFVAFVVPADDVIVGVRDDAFVPASVTVLPGTTVTWIWPTTVTAHNIESIGGSVLPERSGDPVDGPFLFSQEIFFSGLYNYQCAEHGTQGTIHAGP